MRQWWANLSIEEKREKIARRDAAKVKAAERRRYLRHRADRLAAGRDYRRTEAGKARSKAAQDRYRQKYPEKYKAHNAVAAAIRNGVLQRESCEQEGEACLGKIHAHHDDHTKPLDVRWLCRFHHMQHHGLVL